MGKKKYQEYWNWIVDHNKGRHDSTKEKLYTRVLSARSRWSDRYDITKDQIDSIIKQGLGKKCPYCGKEITTENMSLDHKHPQSSGGTSDIDNLQLIDNTCNRRKGEMTHEEYKKLISLMEEFREESQKYIKQKLSAKTWY